MSGFSGPTVSVHTPSSPFVNATGLFPAPSAVSSATPDNCTSLAAGARRRKVTVRSSRTSGEFSLALNGTRFSVFFCGL